MVELDADDTEVMSGSPLDRAIRRNQKKYPFVANDFAVQEGHS